MSLRLTPAGERTRAASRLEQALSATGRALRDECEISSRDASNDTFRTKEELAAAAAPAATNELEELVLLGSAALDTGGASDLAPVEGGGRTCVRYTAVPAGPNGPGSSRFIPVGPRWSRFIPSGPERSRA